MEERGGRGGGGGLRGGREREGRQGSRVEEVRGTREDSSGIVTMMQGGVCEMCVLPGGGALEDRWGRTRGRGRPGSEVWGSFFCHKR